MHKALTPINKNIAINKNIDLLELAVECLKEAKTPYEIKTALLRLDSEVSYLFQEFHG